MASAAPVSSRDQAPIPNPGTGCHFSSGCIDHSNSAAPAHPVQLVDEGNARHIVPPHLAVNCDGLALHATHAAEAGRAERSRCRWGRKPCCSFSAQLRLAAWLGFYLHAAVAGRAGLAGQRGGNMTSEQAIPAGSQL